MAISDKFANVGAALGKTAVDAGPTGVWKGLRALGQAAAGAVKGKVDKKKGILKGAIGAVGLKPMPTSMPLPKMPKSMPAKRTGDTLSPEDRAYANKKYKGLSSMDGAKVKKAADYVAPKF